MTASPTPPTEPAGSLPPSLRCLGGKPAPAEIATDLARLATLPPSARERFWEALGPSLSEPVPPAVEQRLDAFCAAHGARGDDLARALRAARFLVREAAAAGLSAADLSADIAAIAGEGAPAAAVLLAGYDRACPLIQREIAERALRAHGALLTGADGRLDVIAATAEGARLSTPIVLLTVRYETGDRPERLTLQALPGEVRELRDLCDRLLAALPPARR